MTVKIPADVDREDRIVAGLTARQLIILGTAGLVLYGAWQATRAFVPLPLFLAVAVPVAVITVVVAVGQRDGVALDRLLVAAIRHQLTPRRRVFAPEGVPAAPAWATGGAQRGRRARRAQAVDASPLELPVTGTTDTGVVDLGREGMAVIGVCSTVNFALRTPGEQEALVAAFGRFLHSLSAPAQVLVRVQQLDLTAQITQLRHQATALPHPALERAARSHASFLATLSADTDLLHRQVLLVLREHHPQVGVAAGARSLATVLSPLRGRRKTGAADDERRQAVENRLAQRLAEAAGLLAAAGITLSPLDAGQTRAVLASACDPDSAIGGSPELAGPDEVITTAPAGDEDPLLDAIPSHHPDNADDARVALFRDRYAR